VIGLRSAAVALSNFVQHLFQAQAENPAADIHFSVPLILIQLTSEGLDDTAAHA
jgi:hypothetical protein